MIDYTEKQKELSAKFKALAHPARVKLLQDLLKKECCVGEIQECLSISQPNVNESPAARIRKTAGSFGIEISSPLIPKEEKSAFLVVLV